MKITSVAFVFIGLLTITLASHLKSKESEKREVLLQTLQAFIDGQVKDDKYYGVQQILPEVWCYDNTKCQGDPINPLFLIDIYKCCKGHPFRSYIMEGGFRCQQCAPGGASIVSQDRKSMYRYRNDEAELEPQVEYQQFHGVIINRSDKKIGGTGDLTYGKWMPHESPQFPIASNCGTMAFASQGAAFSPTGTTGEIRMNVNGVAGELVIDFDCPYDGTSDNKCELSGKIPGLKFSRISFSGTGGTKASCVVMIENEY